MHLKNLYVYGGNITMTTGDSITLKNRTGVKQKSTHSSLMKEQKIKYALTSTATFWLRAVISFPRRSINVDFPAPGDPDSPMLQAWISALAHSHLLIQCRQ